MADTLSTKSSPGAVSEMMTVVGVITVLVVMIIPLPPFLLDFLLLQNQ
jgi:flagellar biosynthesis component FlhA